MKKIIWEVKAKSYLPITKYCKKCGKKTEYKCSGFFRVNSQRKHIDIWLIYKCELCDTTWNLTIYSRINPASINIELLEKFHTNNKELVEKYAFDSELLIRNGAEIGIPDYQVLGEKFDLNSPLELCILSKYSLPIKLSSILRNYLNLSQKSFYQALETGQIHGDSGQHFKKCKLQNKNTIFFEKFLKDKES